MWALLGPPSMSAFILLPGYKRPSKPDRSEEPCLRAHDLRASARSPAATSRVLSRMLWLHPVHEVTGGDNRTARAGSVVDVALLHVFGRDEGDQEVAVEVGTDDRSVVIRHRPGEGFFGIGDRRRRAPPEQPALLALHDIGHLDLAHARRIGRGL